MISATPEPPDRPSPEVADADGTRSPTIETLMQQLTAADQAELETLFGLLRDAAQAQHQVFVHRDYHSRNLMVVADGNPGILDFQDAVLGPVTYDLVSLLRDCYIAWPDEQVYAWVEGFRQKLPQDHLTDEEIFRRDFDLHD